MPIIIETHSIQLNNSSYSINLSASPINYIITPGHPYTWINASSGTILPLGDDDSALTPLPFNFTFYDGHFNEIYITSEGYLTFSSSNVRLVPTIPSSHPHEHNIIAPYWTNLDGTSGEIYVKNSSSYWVVAWENFNLDNSSYTGSFEAVLYKSGDIVFNYDRLENVSTYACGLNYGDGDNYSSYNELTSGINDFSIKFSLTIGDGGLPSDIINTIVIVVVTVSIVSAAGGITLYFYRKNPEQFKAKLSRSKARIKEGASKLKEKFKKKSVKSKEKVSKDTDRIKTKSPKEE